MQFVLRRQLRGVEIKATGDRGETEVDLVVAQLGNTVIIIQNPAPKDVDLDITRSIVEAGIQRVLAIDTPVIEQLTGVR